jgi:hypothetical protein
MFTQSQQMYQIKNFSDWIEQLVVTVFGSWEQMDKLTDITDGNRRITRAIVNNNFSYQIASSSQVRAWYGRSTPSFANYLIGVTGMNSQDSFIDVGCGIGTVVMQIASILGNKCTGIELCDGRYRLAKLIRAQYAYEWPSCEVNLIHSDLRNPLCVEECRNHSVMFANNGNNCFSEQNTIGGNMSLDYHIARIGCGMKNGSQIVTLQPLMYLESPTAQQCFHKRVEESMNNAVSWTRDTVQVHIYTKKQDIWKCAKCGKYCRILLTSGSIWTDQIQSKCECELIAEHQIKRHKS